jgi:RNA polymerase sigma factor (sigma-70 family)
MVVSDVTAQRALKWVLDLDDEQCTRAELVGLDAWLAEDPEHARAFWAMEAAWRAATSAKECQVAATHPTEGWMEQVKALEGSLRACLEDFARNDSDVENLLQETYSRLKTRRHRVWEADWMAAFCVQVARDVATDWLKRRKGDALGWVEGAETEMPDERATVERIVSVHDDLALLTRAILELPARCREVFTLRKVYGYNQSEIAELLGIEEQTVAMHLSRALQHCSKALGGTRCARSPELIPERRKVEARR